MGFRQIVRKTLWFTKALIRRAQLLYELWIAPFLAQYGWWLFWPVYRVFKRKNVIFVVNIANATGHVLFEFDNFCRIQKLSQKKNFVCILKKTEFFFTAVEFYKSYFAYASANTILYNLILPITMYYKDLVLDCGLSRMKWQLPKRSLKQMNTRQTFLHQVSKQERIQAFCQQFERMKKTKNFYPLLLDQFSQMSEEFKTFIQKDARKIALIHLKDVVRNATADPTDPVTYLGAIEHLLSLNYNLIFAGREKMPEVFKKYGIINYANSKFASFKNDFYLFYAADLFIVSGSGIAMFAEYLGKYSLYLNSWHAFFPLFFSHSIQVPTRVQEKSGKWLTFKQQSHLYRSLPDLEGEVFPQDHYQAENASSLEILEALKELIFLQGKWTPMSPLQLKFKNLEKKAPSYLAESRCSEFFLQNHPEWLE